MLGLVIGVSTVLTGVITRSCVTGALGGALLACWVWWKRWMALWVPSSPAHLQKFEALMLANTRAEIHHLNVTIADGLHLHTLQLKGTSTESPLVLLHGYGGGSGLWAKNLDALLSTGRTVYCVDLLGFGRSSRPLYTGKGVTDAVQWWMKSIEAWRAALGLEQFVLLGHSLGGYLAVHYALLHPSRLAGLIMLSPFGIGPRRRNFTGLSWHLRMIKAFVTSTSPSVALRTLGPFGPRLLFRWRGNYDNGRYDFTDNRAADYAYHLVAVQGGSGDAAFMHLIDTNGNAVSPVLERIPELQMPFSVICGTSDIVTGNHIVDIESRSKVKCAMFPIVNGGHHVYATHSDLFHDAVAKSLELTLTSTTVPSSFQRKEKTR